VRKVGRQSLKNTLNHIESEDFDWIKDNVSKDNLTVKLKKEFFHFDNELFLTNE